MPAKNSSLISGGLSRGVFKNLSRGVGPVGLSTRAYQGLPQRRPRPVPRTGTRSRTDAENSDIAAQYSRLGLQTAIPPDASGGDDRAKVLAGIRATSTIQTHANRLHAAAGAHQVARAVAQIQASPRTHCRTSGARPRPPRAQDVPEKAVGYSEDTGACETADRAETIQEDQVRVSIAR